MNKQNNRYKKYLKEYYNLINECDNKGINWNELFYMFCICKGYINSKKESYDLIEWIDNNNVNIYE